MNVGLWKERRGVLRNREIFPVNFFKSMFKIHIQMK